MIDTHAHLASPQLSSDIEHYLDLARQAGVEGILTVGTTAADSQRCVDLTKQFTSLRAAVGIHPNNCHQVQEDDWHTVCELAADSRVVAIGETGLDRYWDDCPWELQLHYLERHIDLARATGLPIVVHTRDCVDETIALLAEQYRVQPFAAVMHSFTGSADAARRCIELGFYISFAGMLTFKNSMELRKVAALIPLDRLLIETDSPYLTPHPLRGQRPNHPALMRYTLECLAGQCGIQPDELDQHLVQNATSVFSRWNYSIS